MYKVQEGLNSRFQDIKRRVAKDEEYFDKFEEVNFDDGETSEKETVNDLAHTKKVTLMDKVMRRLSADQEDLINNYREYLEKADDYRINAVYVAVLEEGLSYVRGLSSAFESFFRSFDSKVAGMEKEIRAIEGRYRYQKGTAKRYVCASKECLNAMAKKITYTGGAIELDGDLAEAIYLRVRKYSMLSIRSDNVDYFSSIFNDDIIGYFVKKLMESYSDSVDLDILTAIEKEAEYEHNILDEARVEEYVKDVIGTAKILAAPFIEKPIGEEKDPINSCAFNDKLSPRDDSPRANLISEQLFDFGGEADADIPKNKILFYKSFYGLRANDLSKFAPPQRSETYDRSGGEYFKAYYELVGKIHPIPSKSKVITPHIDRWWHNVTKMPDLDEHNQEKQFDEIYAAFFWGLVGGYIDLFEYGANQRVYRLIGSQFGKEESARTLTVSNGTPCDQLYEVLDALAIYPELVNMIMKQVRESIDEEVAVGKNAKNNNLVEMFDSFKIKQLSDTSDETKERSIFELPFMLKKSMTSEIYEEEKVLRIVDVAIKETEYCLKAFCTESDYPETVGELFLQQFNKLVKNLAADNIQGTNIYHDYLFVQLCEILATELKELGLEDAPKKVKDKEKELCR